MALWHFCTELTIFLQVKQTNKKYIDLIENQCGIAQPPIIKLHTLSSYLVRVLVCVCVVVVAVDNI